MTPPPAWRQTRLDRVASVNARIGWKALTASEYQPDGYVFLATPNIKSESIDFQSVNYISEDRYEESPELKLRSGDVLLAKDGSTLGITNVIHSLPRPATVNGSIAVLRSFDVEPRFLRYSLESSPIQGLIEALKGGMGVPHLFQWDIKRLPLSLPSLAEQRRIADFLDAETAQIGRMASVQESARKVLNERREAAIFDAVTGRPVSERRPSRLAWVDTLPARWQDAKLSHVARMGTGHTPSRNKPEWWVDCTIPWVTTGDVARMRSDRIEVLADSREKISKVGMLNSSAEIHPQNTVVLCRTASAGYSAVMGQDMATSQDFATWTCGPRLDPFFLLWCLRAMRTDLLDRLAMGSTHKTIYMPDLQGLRIPLPNTDEQAAIVGEIRKSNAAIDAAKDAIERQLELLSERRRALITAAVTGQFDVATTRGVAV
ncbi:restriction endonuclease subunit S [Kribbella sp. NPDC054772]